MRFLASETQCAEDRRISGHVGRHVRCSAEAQSGTDFVDEGALGVRVVSHARIPGRRRLRSRGGEAAQNEEEVKFNKKYGAITSKIAKAGSCRAGLHGVRCMGMPPTRLKAFRTTVGRCLPGKHAGRSLTWRVAAHECDPINMCRVEPRGMGGRSLGRTAGRCRSAQGPETAATTGGPEAVVESDGCHHRVFEATGMNMASPHGLRHCKWTRSGLATDMLQGTSKRN